MSDIDIVLNKKILVFAVWFGYTTSYDSPRSKSHVALGSPLLLPAQNPESEVKVNGLYI